MLIVDNNMVVRELMAVIVGSLGNEVPTAGDAAGALELIRGHRNIDLLVNGLELARRARALRPGLPVLRKSS